LIVTLVLLRPFKDLSRASDLDGVDAEAAMRSTTKSALALAREALTAARASLPLYSSPFSRKEYTQHQHFAILVLRQFLRTDYRGIVEILLEWSDLRVALGLSSVPHYSTLCYAEQQLLKGGRLNAFLPPFSSARVRSA